MQDGSKDKVVYIFWTCRDQEEAKKIIYALVEQKWIACASIFPEITSIYRWEGKVEEGREVKIILKTVARHFDAVQGYIKAHGSYQVPEIIQLNVEQGNPDYLSWVKNETALVQD
jgi:periplasmic divalent cation tolerance protein